MLTITRALNVYASGIPQIINLSQYDDDWRLIFNLYTSTGTFNMPPGTTAQIQGTKTDGNGYQATAVVSNNTVAVSGDVQITAAAGANDFEIVIFNNNKRLSTINFTIQVEHAALDADTVTSETVLKDITNLSQAVVDAEAAADRAEEAARTLTIDPTLTQSGQAADAKVTGDEINDIKEDLEQLEPGLPDEAKEALLTCFRHVVWTDEHGADYINDLEEALYAGGASLVSITAVFNSGQNVIYDITPLNDLKRYLTVTGQYDDGTTKSVSNYTLTGTLSEGTSTITVIKDEVTTTFNVTVEKYWTYEWSYTDGLPSDNGMTRQFVGTVTETLENDGLRVVVDDTSDKKATYQYSGLSSTDLYTNGIFELEFIINRYGSYSYAPYGNGVRLYGALGARNGNALKCAELTFNTSGIIYLKANTTGWTVLNSTPFDLNTLYKARIEQSGEKADVYINDEYAGTITAEDAKENVTIPQFLAYRGPDVTFKAYRLRVTV
jgi:hypothetical protein